MQKLAVALTTQQEFDEYMIWRKKRWRNTNYVWGHHDFPAVCIAHEDQWRWACLGTNEDMYDKLISCKEAIGEKEIIREGEAIGFEPKTGDWVMVSDDWKDHWVKALYICTPSVTDWFPYKVASTDEQIKDFKSGSDYKHSAFRYIKQIEDQPEREWWIHEAYDYFEADSRCMMWWPNGRELFFEAIEKHMPKLTKEDVRSICDLQACFKSFASYSKIVELLKSKWLLE